MGIDVKALRAGAAAVLAQTLGVKNAEESPAAVGAALHFALGAQLSDHDPVALCRQVRRAGRLVASALGREPGQGRQRHHAGFRFGPGGSAQPAAVVPRWSRPRHVHHPDGGYQGQRPDRAEVPRPNP